MKKNVLRFIWFSLIVLLGTTADLVTKSWIFERLGLPGAQDAWWLIPNLFAFQTSLNQGALFGMGQGQIVFFVILSFCAIIGILSWIVFDRKKSLYLATTLGLLTAGILGNLWDRLGFHGLKWTELGVQTGQCDAEMIGQPVHAVRDWILVMIGSYHWPNFNIADSMLVCGAGLILLFAWLWGDPFIVEKTQTENTIVEQTENEVHEA